MDKRTGKSVAIKVIDVENAEDEVDDIIQEINILSELNSPFVTKYYGSFLKGSDLWIVMEYCSGGSCSDLMKPGLITEEYISIIVRELLMGLEYLHSDNKLHRDIKGTCNCLNSIYRSVLRVSSGKYLAQLRRSSQTRRFWRLRTALCYHDQKKYLCWDTLLDGT